MSRTKGQDVCAYLFEICRECQSEFLDASGITCLFEVHGGALSAWRCGLAGQIVRTLIAEICRARPMGGWGGEIAVTLRHDGQVWMLAVVDKGVRKAARTAEDTLVSSVRRLSMPLNGTWHSRRAPEGSITALMFFVAGERLIVAGGDEPAALTSGADARVRKFIRSAAIARTLH